MTVLKWVCFILVCFDTLAYIEQQLKKIDCFARVIGLSLGIAARVYVLSGAFTCWLMV